MKTYLYVDSNVLLRCRALRELPWGDVAPEARERCIVVLPTVVGEVDRRKYLGSEAAQQRARSISALFRRMIMGDDDGANLGETATRLHLVEGELRPDWKDGMEKDHADDRLLAELLGHAVEANACKLLVTHDTTPMIRAKHFGVEVFPVPDTWLRPPEDVNLKKRVHSLEKQLASLRNPRPDVKIWFGGDAEKRIETIRLRVHPLTPVDDEAYRGLAKELHNPRDQSTVYDTPWDEFYEEYVKYLANLAQFLDCEQRASQVTLCLENVGASPVEHLELEISGTGGILLMREAYQEPEPPSEPKPRSLASYQVADHWTKMPEIPPPMSYQKPERDPTAFYWEREGYTLEQEEPLQLTCDRFQHQSGVDLTPFQLMATLQSNGGEVAARVSGSNLPRPVTTKLVVKVDRREEPRDTLALLRDWLSGGDSD